MCKEQSRFKSMPVPVSLSLHIIKPIASASTINRNSTESLVHILLTSPYVSRDSFRAWARIYIAIQHLEHCGVHQLVGSLQPTCTQRFFDWCDSQATVITRSCPAQFELETAFARPGRETSTLDVTFSNPTPCTWRIKIDHKLYHLRYR